MSYYVHRQLQGPTAIEQSVFARLTDPGILHLVVAKGQVVEVYEVLAEETEVCRLQQKHVFFLMLF